MEKKIICLAGELASGKGAVSDYIKERYSGEYYRFSDAFRKILDVLHLTCNRKNLSNLSLHIRKAFGEDVLSQAMVGDIEKSASRIIVIDGMRRIEEIDELQKLPGFQLVFVDTDLETRFERIKKRGENADDCTKTLEEFKKDHTQNADVTIKDLKEKADNIIDNNGTLEELHMQVDELVRGDLSV